MDCQFKKGPHDTSFQHRRRIDKHIYLPARRLTFPPVLSPLVSAGVRVTYVKSEVLKYPKMMEIVIKSGEVSFIISQYLSIFILKISKCQFFPVSCAPTAEQFFLQTGPRFGCRVHEDCTGTCVSAADLSSAGRSDVQRSVTCTQTLFYEEGNVFDAS